MSHIEIPLKPCPWCKKTPELLMPIEDDETCKTRMWHIECKNSQCDINPRSKYICIRNTKKKSVFHIIDKLKELENMWNTNNDTIAYEKKVVNITRML